MKLLYFNLNYGSALEYAGDIFESWLKELSDITLLVIKNQDSIFSYIEKMKMFKPDVIIINEYNRRVIEPVFYYSQLSGCKIIFMWHVWQSLVNPSLEIKKNDSVKNDEDLIKLTSVLLNSETIFCINYCQDLEKIPEEFRYKLKNFYYPTDPEIFNYKIKWNERSKKFLYLGNILPHKLSEEFLKKITNTDITIDCFGRKYSENQYYDIFNSTTNMKYYGLIDQSKVSKILNEYKYLVIPHNGFEPFNWVLLQSMFCGTIPLVVNDRNSNKFNPSWIDWASGLYLGCNTVDEMIINLKHIQETNPDMVNHSEFISKESNIKFNYNNFKKSFQNEISNIKEKKI